jgi:hypothetical protein
MKTDYAYCMTTKCIHRRGCKRWIGNYTDEEYKKIKESGRVSYIDDYDCENHDDEEMQFYMLDRFRSSTGEDG